MNFVMFGVRVVNFIGNAVIVFTLAHAISSAIERARRKKEAKETEAIASLPTIEEQFEMEGELYS
jgi:large-conductance mechanosensitive channel